MYVVIAGCGRVGSQFAKLLDQEGHDVVVLDADRTSVRRLGSGYGGDFVVGNAFDTDDLVRAGIEQADVFCALTNLDNTNIMACQVAKRIFDVPEVIGRLYNPERLSTYQKLGLNMVCGTSLIATELKNRVVTPGYDTVEVLPSGDTEVIVLKATPKMVGRRLADLTLHKEYVPVAFIREGVGEVASPDDVVRENDYVYFSIRSARIPEFLRRFGASAERSGR